MAHRVDDRPVPARGVGPHPRRRPDRPLRGQPVRRAGDAGRRARAGSSTSPRSPAWSRLRLQCAFVAAKAGVVNLTKAMALELGPHGILVNGIAPGSTLTEGTRKLFYGEGGRSATRSSRCSPTSRSAAPPRSDEIAVAALFLADPENSYMNGHILTVDGGWTAGLRARVLGRGRGKGRDTHASRPLSLGRRNEPHRPPRHSPGGGTADVQGLRRRGCEASIPRPLAAGGARISDRLADLAAVPDQPGRADRPAQRRTTAETLLIDGNTGTQLDVPPHSVTPPDSGLPNAGPFGRSFTEKIPAWQFGGEACVIDCRRPARRRARRPERPRHEGTGHRLGEGAPAARPRRRGPVPQRLQRQVLQAPARGPAVRRRPGRGQDARLARPRPRLHGIPRRAARS